MSADEPTPACESALPGWTNAESHRLADETDVATLDPCGHCFPDGEIDVDREQLVRVGGRETVHRDAALGEPDWQSRQQPGQKPSAILEEMDPDDLLGSQRRDVA